MVQYSETVCLLTILRFCVDMVAGERCDPELYCISPTLRCDETHYTHYSLRSCCYLPGDDLGLGPESYPTSDDLARCCDYGYSCVDNCADGKCPNGLRQLDDRCTSDSDCHSNNCAPKPPNYTSSVCTCMEATSTNECDPSVTLEQVCCGNSICTNSFAFAEDEYHCCLPFGARCQNGTHCCGGNCVDGHCAQAFAGGPCTLTTDCAGTGLCDSTTSTCANCIAHGGSCSASNNLCCGSLSCEQSKCCKRNGEYCDGDASQCCNGACTVGAEGVCKSTVAMPCKQTDDCDTGSGLVCDLGTETCTTCIADGVRCCTHHDCPTSPYAKCIGGECIAPLYIACLPDNDHQGPFKFSPAAMHTSTAMTVEKCQYLCFTGSGGREGIRYYFAALENGNQCYCGNKLATQESASGCDTNCAGNTAEKCGGSWTADVYLNLNTQGKRSQLLFCAVDHPASPLSDDGTSFPMAGLTIEKCLAACFNNDSRAEGRLGDSSAIYSYAGVGYGNVCLCANELFAAETTTGCNVSCPSNAAQSCGGENAVNVYANEHYGTCRWKFLYCSANLDFNVYVQTTTMTTAACQAYCKSRNYHFAAVKAVYRCSCGNYLPHSYLEQVTCGGLEAQSLYFYTCKNEPEWSSWEHNNCTRLLGNGVVTIQSDQMTRSLCESFCYVNGKHVAGITEGRYCHCFIVVPAPLPADCSCACDARCAGDENETCGGYHNGCSCDATESTAINFVVDIANSN